MVILHQSLKEDVIDGYEVFPDSTKKSLMQHINELFERDNLEKSVISKKVSR